MPSLSLTSRGWVCQPAGGGAWRTAGLWVSLDGASGGSAAGQSSARLRFVLTDPVTAAAPGHAGTDPNTEPDWIRADYRFSLTCVCAAGPLDHRLILGAAEETSLRTRVWI